MTPPKPAFRPRRTSLWRHFRAFRRDILSAQPEHLFRARMAEFRTPFFRSFLLNEPDLVAEVLKHRPADFPKSERVTEGLRPLLGDAVFVTNGETWARQRRIIDPAFDAARLGAVFPGLFAAAEAAAVRLTSGETEIEAWASHGAADAIFRTLFSIPIDDRLARATYEAFRTYQRSQPLLNLAAFLPLPRWAPRLHRPNAKRAARQIRALIADLVALRLEAIADGTAPDDLATRILTAEDPETGQRFAADEMIDQVAIFFLAGHETSAAALSWALYLLATHPDAQDRAATEARAFARTPTQARLAELPFTRDVFRETLRLYPPVPMMAREATRPESFRNRSVPEGAQIVLSPWHLHRNPRHWSAPDAFDPDRWSTTTQRSGKGAFLPFSAGPRVCPGASFAMAEGVIFLAAVLARWRLEASGDPPVPAAHLTLRSEGGIHLDLSPRDPRAEETRDSAGRATPCRAVADA